MWANNNNNNDNNKQFYLEIEEHFHALGLGYSAEKDRS